MSKDKQLCVLNTSENKRIKNIRKKKSDADEILEDIKPPFEP